MFPWNSSHLAGHPLCIPTSISNLLCPKWRWGLALPAAPPLGSPTSGKVTPFFLMMKPS